MFSDTTNLGFNLNSVTKQFQKNVNTNYQVKSNLIDNKNLKADTVSFGRRAPEDSAKAKMVCTVNKILDNEINLKPGQMIKVTADKSFMPFLATFAEEAYKRHSGAIIFDIKEPELEALKKKYYPDHKWKAETEKEAYLKENGAAEITFDKKHSPYKEANLTKAEISAINKPFNPIIPKEVQKELSEAFNEKAIFSTLLNIQKGQPIRITAEREHEPNVLKFVKYAYEQGSGPIEVAYGEYGSVLGKARLKYADESVLETVAPYIKTTWKERVANNTATLNISGDDPEALKDVDPKRIIKSQKALSAVIKPIRQESDSQWNIYYAPTTMSVKKTYPEYSNIMDALHKAAVDAKDINRCDHLESHGARLSTVADKINAMGIERVHFISVDPETKEPDGKTDLYIGLTDKSNFMAAVEKTRSGVTYMPNTPTEEVFTSPDRTKTNGWVSTTLPLCLNGNIIEGIRMRFENGKAVEVYADKNQELWREHVKSCEGADMLGEVALVAGSPIFETGRVFNDTLLDENAACHIAIGSGFDDCIEGAKEIENHKERQAYLKDNNINDSNIHTDFMIGGPNVIVEGITKEGERITLIEDNEFQV